MYCRAMLATAIAVGMGVATAGAAPGAFALRAADFANGAPMPAAHEGNIGGCTGKNQAVGLRWSGAPAGTRSFALTTVDPDAPKSFAPRGFVHWVAYNIPATATALGSGARFAYSKGTNGAGRVGYGGPCPPKGDAPHHYHFTLYALDLFQLPGKALTREALEAAIKGHVLGKATVIGTFQRR